MSDFQIIDGSPYFRTKKEAKTLLETTDYTIAEIATFNGFSSQSFFTQAFKRTTNKTPTFYRKAARAGK